MYIHNKRRRAKLREFLFWLKKKLRCHACGQRVHPYILQFDHDRGMRKKLAVAHAATKNNTAASLIREIVKCTPRCANCHQLKTWDPEAYRKMKKTKVKRPKYIENEKALWKFYRNWEENEWTLRESIKSRKN